MQRFILVHVILASLVVSDTFIPTLRADDLSQTGKLIVPPPKKSNYIKRTWNRRPSAFKRKKKGLVPPAQVQLSASLYQTRKPKTPHGLKKLWARRRHILNEIEIVGAEVAVGTVIAAGVAGLVYLAVQNPGQTIDILNFSFGDSE